MATFLERIIGRSGKDLPALLTTYPPYLGPFPGDSDELLPGQAEANLAHLLEHRQARVAAVLGLLAARGLRTDDALVKGDPEPFLHRLWKWIEAEWPGIHSKRLTQTDACRNPRGDGEEKALSLVTDVGILLGEMILERRPGFRWALDLDPENQGYENGSVSQKQPVVFKPGRLLCGNIMLDTIGIMESVYRRCKGDPWLFVLNRLADAVSDITSGAAEQRAAERESLWQ